MTADNYPFHTTAIMISQHNNVSSELNASIAKVQTSRECKATKKTNRVRSLSWETNRCTLEAALVNRRGTWPSPHLKDFTDDTDNPKLDVSQSTAEDIKEYLPPQDHHEKMKDDKTDIPADETQYTVMFQKYFAVGVSLKNKIKKDINQIKGVESVGLGFSTERDGYWPVIRVIVDEETCEEMKADKERKTTLTREVTAVLKEVLTQLHPSTSWDEEELISTIQIIIKYPLKAYELCSAGDMVETTYSFHDTISNKIDRRQGTMGYSVCNKVITGDEEHTSHYEVTAYHPLIPTHSVQFRQTLPPIPTTNTSSTTSVRYQYITECPDQDIVLTTSPPNDSLLLPTVLRATVFPQQTKCGFQLLKDRFSYTNNIHYKSQTVPLTQTRAELVVGKSGLVKYSTTAYDEGTYEYNIVANDQTCLYNNHPCNIDIAALYVPEQEEGPTSMGGHQNNTCSFEELFSGTLQPCEGVTLPPSITWCGPPDKPSIETQKGKVVYIKDGTVYRLSDKLIKFTDPPQPDEYPGYSWELADDVQVPLGHSGAPVFLVTDCRDCTTFHLLGNLITPVSASPVKFSLGMVRDEITIHHIDQILAKQQPYLPESLNTDMIKRLQQYKEYLIRHSEEQSLTPWTPTQYIRCELSICIHPHQ